MRVAVIDLGTNTFNLLIADVHGRSFEVVYAGREVVKLGEKSINENRISDLAFERGIRAFLAHANTIKQKNAEVVRALATSAIREASNGKDFTDRIFRETGIDVEVIDGEREAELIYHGNRMAVDLGDKPSLIMDIGGGSNEFIIASSDRVLWKQSFKLGVARLLEKFKPEDPITDATLAAIKAYLAQELQPLADALRQYQVNCLVGSSGGFESVVDMVADTFEKKGVMPGQHCYDLDLSEYFKVSELTIRSTSAQRQAMKGLIPMRRDMIVLTYLLIDHVLRTSGVAKMKVSTYALKEGALSEYIVNNC